MMMQGKSPENPMTWEPMTWKKEASNQRRKPRSIRKNVDIVGHGGRLLARFVGEIAS